MEDAKEIKVAENAVEEEFEEDTQKDKYLSFIVNNKIYALDIKYIIEILGMQRITFVPNVKPYIKGIMSLRGNITPVVDIRLRFNIEEKKYDEKTCIIVVEHENHRVGLIVDEVADVLKITEDKIAPPPKTNKGSRSKYIKGIGKLDDKIVILISLYNLLFDGKLEEVESLE